MRTLNRVGSIVAGAVMLGAAISGAVNASMDDTGMTKGFFYDAGYNPIVQIVVGEKGMATDAVAAGNIAAVIGNLAYTSTTAAAAGGTAGGQVVLGISAKGATGKYEQADRELDMIETNADEDVYDFYSSNDGLPWDASMGVETYTRGEFISYSLACDQQERTESGILKKGTYNNIHCLFCETLCLSALENPEHTMEESIAVDFDKITWYEDGLGSDDAEALTMKIDSKAITYILDAGYVPMNKIYATSAEAGNEIDFEWRGQMILFGEEYYVKNIQGLDKIYLAKGKILDDISSEGYTSEYMGYKFKIDHLIYSEEYKVAGILLDVEKPDGTVVQTQISKMANGIVDDIEIAGVYAEEADAVATASLIVYDTTTNVLLEDSKDMELGGEVKKYWKVSIDTQEANESSVDISDYNDAVAGDVLNNVTVQYRHSAELKVGEELDFPSTYKVVFDGFRTNDYVESPCSGAGEGDIKIEREGKYRGLISFTGDDGQRYNGVYMDQGPFSQGDMFVLGGLVYEYDDAAELTTDDEVMRITLKDLLNGGKRTYDLDAIAQTTSFSLWTYPFEEASSNAEETTVEPDSVAADSDVYVGDGPQAYILYDGGDMYLVENDMDEAGTGSLIDNETIGINQNIFSADGGTNVERLEKFELGDADVGLSVVNENTTYDLNLDRDTDADDRLIQFDNGDTEYIVIDFYSRSFDDTADTYYSEGLWTSGNALSLSAAWTAPYDDPATDYTYKFQDEQDTVAIVPMGGTTATIDYGGARQVESVTICQPQDNVYATLFIGTSEQATTIDTTITKADEGTEKSVGCCTYLIKEFGVTTSGSTAATVKVNPIVGNLVVPEIAADTTKNLVIVGGPAVNGMCGLTKDEIQAASGQYVVKMDGNKVYVAGWTAADTVDAGNAL
ncbi:MAG: S-layer protein, partial [Candidatus Altiarchaeota archaeon]